MAKKQEIETEVLEEKTEEKEEPKKIQNEGKKLFSTKKYEGGTRLD